MTHWPVSEKYVDTYKAIERLYDEKLIRTTGVSNHHAHHLEKIFVKANVAPMVNQIELHPYLTQEPLRAFCKENGIAVTLGHRLHEVSYLQNQRFLTYGEQYGKTPAQVIIRWHLQNNLIVIPKSVTPERIRENIEVADFELSSKKWNRLMHLIAMNGRELTRIHY